MTDLIDAVRKHALDNYDHPKQGWDHVVECYSDADIAEVIGNARTIRGAIAKFRSLVSVYREQDNNARIETEMGGGRWPC